MKCVQWEPSCCMWTDAQTDRRGEAKSRFSQFYESAQNLFMQSSVLFSLIKPEPTI